jgi:ABC-type bacteriocin/lantibiotic exporter with double-glycine peptidase domain
MTNRPDHREARGDVRGIWPSIAGRTRVAALALAALGACRATAPPPPPQLSPGAIVLATPVVEQDELYECGLVAVSALCRFHGVEIPAELRASLVATAAERKGLSGDELRAALAQVGLETFLFPGTLDDSPTGLFHHLAKGRPLIVMTSERESDHYVLFIGHDPAQGLVVLLDPRRGRVVLPHAVFERLWEPAGRFTLLALPASSEALPPTPRNR